MKNLAGFLFIISTVIIFTGCSNKPQGDFAGSEWIQDNGILPGSDSLFYLDNPAPLFRKEFNIKGKPESARLLITAAGYYKFSINGTTNNDNLLSPAWTDFSKRIYYSDYDISGMVKEGRNCIGVVLGNGFYNPLPLKMWGHLNLRDHLNTGKPAFIATLEVKYKDGRTVRIKSDSSWRYSYGPVVRNNVYLGVVYNGNYEKPGWNIPGYDDNDWKNAEVSGDPGGMLQRAFFAPVKVIKTVPVVRISRLDDNCWIADMGVNYTGTYSIRLKGEKGDTVILRFGERIYDTGELNPMTAVCGQIKRKGVGGPGAPDIAWQQDTFIFGPEGNITFTPDFTYHTFRYMEISGIDYEPQESDILGHFISTDLDVNKFTSSSGIINSIQDAVVRTFQSNLVSVQSDCAAREKFGYGGDLNATSEAFIRNFDMHDFYRKTVYDWADAINDTIFVDTAPYVGINYCGLSWESAFLITQYYLYLYYNDTGLIEEMYEADIKWMDKAASLHPGGTVDSGLSDHESLENVPVQLTGTAHYLQCARIMKIFSEIMNDTDGMKRFEKLESELLTIMRNDFWLKPVYQVKNRQTLLAILIHFDIIPEEQMQIAADSLEYYVSKAGHFTTGIFGTKYILSALTMTGNASLAGRIVMNPGYPGWAHMIANGATTIWETWEESDNTYSNNHPMFGTVSEWLCSSPGGINPDPSNPGFKTFILSPDFITGIDSVYSSYKSPQGVIVSSWKKTGVNNYFYEIHVPEGSTALLHLKANINPVTMDGDSLVEKGEVISRVNYKKVYEVGGGDYGLNLIFTDL